MSAPDVVIASAKRTPIGAFLGALSPLTAVQLGSAAAQAAVQASGLAPGDIQEVIMGCVLPANLGQAPARQAALGAGVPIATPATTINKMCGSGLKAVMMAADQIRAGGASIVVAGGLESMSNAPYLLPKARSGYRMGHGEVIDHMLKDGLQSPFDGKSMGCFADATASRYDFSRTQQDAFATESVRRAMQALQAGEFDVEVTPVTVKGRKGETVIARDETPGTCDVSKIATMKPAFSKDGTVTAASSSSISDGAAALVVMSAATAAVVTMAAMRDIDIDHARVNVNGGACALGHPIGATGARILTTLVHSLRRRGGRRGIASLCIGGGEAVAMAVETLS